MPGDQVDERSIVKACCMPVGSQALENLIPDLFPAGNVQVNEIGKHCWTGKADEFEFLWSLAYDSTFQASRGQEWTGGTTWSIVANIRAGIE